MFFWSARRRLLTLAFRCIAAVALATGGLAHAQAWPTKPVRLVVPVGAGGTTDILARAVALTLQQSTGQPFVVDLKPGAGGAIGAMEVMRQPPDGHTLLVGTSSSMGVNPAVTPRATLGYGPEDFTPIALLADSNMVLLASPKLNLKGFKEMIDLAKSRPGFINYYSTSPRSYSHLISAMLALQSKTNMTHVPYKGFAQALPDLMSGTMHLAWDAPASALPFVKDGRLQALAVSGPKRSPLMPEVPTLTEAMGQLGLQGFTTTAWFGLYGPRGMAPDLVRRINAEVNKALASAELQARLTALDLAAGQDTPAEFGSKIQADMDRWRRVARDANIRLD